MMKKEGYQALKLLIRRRGRQNLGKTGRWG